MKYNIIDRPVPPAVKWADLKPGALFLYGATACVKLERRATCNGQVVDSMALESGQLFSAEDDSPRHGYRLTVPAEVSLTVTM